MNGFKSISPKTLPDLSELANYESNWFRGDSRENYDRNVADGKDVPYGSKDVNYKFNEMGFRSPPMANASTHNVTAFYGCSIMQGYGLPVEHTIPHLSCKEGTVPFNMGIAGASNDLIARTVISTVPLLNPEAVVVYWTYLTRREIYHESGKPIQWLRNWEKQTVRVSDDCVQYMKAQDDLTHYASNINNFLKNFMLVDLFLKSKGIPYTWGMVDGHCFMYEDMYHQMKEHYDYGFNGSIADLQSDVSRDLMHPGPHTSQLIASHIRSVLERVE